MKFEKTEVWGFEHALRGMRNPLESWEKSDSGRCSEIDCNKCSQDKLGGTECSKIGRWDFAIGKNDMELAQKLIKAGEPHRKFLRQIFVSVDITAPQYFWAEFDTYKIGVVRNSTSMQHKGVSHRYTIDDFEVSDEIKEILKIKEKNIQPLIYPYETNEYKLYVCENGRNYKVFRNGKIISCAYDLKDNLGRIRHFEERECEIGVTNTGYYNLNIGGRNGENWLLHRLVAECWLDNPNSCETVDHKNSNKGDNSVENLEWVTREENIKRQWENFDGFDLQKCYKNWKKSSKINPVEKNEIKRLYAAGMKQKEISQMYEISQSQVSAIILNKNCSSENSELFEHCWYWEELINTLNKLRDKYLDTKDYKYFRLIRQLMPMGYLYKSTITMNYENILNMIKYRENHKLTEWSISFMEWAKSLPYANEFLFLK